MNANQMHDYDYAIEENLGSTAEEIFSLFPSEEDAIFALYEQIFCNMHNLCAQTILDSMKYLIFSKDMTNQMEEICHMSRDDVDTVHHRQLEKAVEETTKEFKHKLYNILEDKLF